MYIKSQSAWMRDVPSYVSPVNASDKQKDY